MLKIAVVQQNGNPGKPDENRTKALCHARRAMENGADIILFHEEMLLGYCENARAFMEPADGPTTQAFLRLIGQSDVCIVYGLTEIDGDTAYISAPILTKDGIVDVYRKTHLWWAAQGLRCETDHYAAGSRLVTFEHRGMRFGVMICYDGDYYEMARSYAKLGCQGMLWMNNRRSRGHHDRVREQASVNSMIFAVSCCCGADETGMHCGGGSNITNFDGSLLGEIWDEEGIIYARVDPEAAMKHRSGNPFYVGMREDIYR